MKNETSGIVIEVNGNIAKVRTSNHADCENCGACPGAAASVINARNPVGAKPGQHVKFVVEESHMLKAAFVVYILPLIGIFLGALLGTWIGKSVGGNLMLFQVIGGAILFILSLVYIKIFDKSAAKDDSVKPVIKSIL
ncbi:SoxR reducing system RseC family protein [Clostridium sp. cel8]|jgi:sigma-E factor negative regulatory protein RseC|uniref:SoxR reducing system RseC family protein n=1 Tax=Clostridium sp. cel8 TaxID=2663123 RepID=UPI0015F6A17A|nr:SoxR reducing system RseC family protein [Clostridium sp. cel8]MBA5850302.1 SoxR reducing system RseC family protein [Clostridium sp. cel8]